MSSNTAVMLSLATVHDSQTTTKAWKRPGVRVDGSGDNLVKALSEALCQASEQTRKDGVGRQGTDRSSIHGVGLEDVGFAQ